VIITKEHIGGDSIKSLEVIMLNIEEMKNTFMNGINKIANYVNEIRDIYEDEYYTEVHVKLVANCKRKLEKAFDGLTGDGVIIDDISIIPAKLHRAMLDLRKLDSLSFHYEDGVNETLHDLFDLMMTEAGFQPVEIEVGDELTDDMYESQEIEFVYIDQGAKHISHIDNRGYIMTMQDDEGEEYSFGIPCVVTASA